MRGSCRGVLALAPLLAAVLAVAVAGLGWGATAARASTWSLTAVPLPAGRAGGELTSVSCTATSACTAVGEYFDASEAPVPLAEGWDGTAWSLQTAPTTSNAGYIGLVGVSCTSTAWCMAVGDYGPPGSNVPATFAEVWDGSGWVIVPSPSPGVGGPNAQLASVSCLSAQACMAVGNYYDGAYPVGLAERWDGSSWSVVPVPEPTGTTESKLFGVSCRRRLPARQGRGV